ncbi:uncharacterized protein UV8b_06373 [Ustilaginoidea virens]|uniref:RING-type domain-containing protein n=1 Tax=Ustilaginoidea virens TaxID=1159556 RepID=A0A063CEP7_USTVR|nr:uncharacterized protein UV8b_06373 [Ustilaginoidea virens]QUC22132.1 hypothetical protein UV8b_06373 [Ustilaginoidea virens]GAO16451.1 hypothetical protein UVI_02048110 [Ustilaginoidea virens]
MSHSKRNTSRAVFTSYERALAKANWSSTSARLNRDSFLPFGSCRLCLNVAREPVACHSGHVFCRECALANLLAQKRELKRADKAHRQAQLKTAQDKAAKDQEDQQRAIRDFELTQAGLGNPHRRSASPTALPNDRRPDDDQGGPARDEQVGGEQAKKELAQSGSKRKFTIDNEELGRIAQEDRAKARKAIDAEKATKSRLPSFWTPSLTPDAHYGTLPLADKSTRTAPICPASTEGAEHAISLQRLVTVQFQEDAARSGTDKQHWICPACVKPLTNASCPVMATSCGHVMCLSCVKKFLIPPKDVVASEPEAFITCYVCDVPISNKPAEKSSSPPELPLGLVFLKSEGTGFAARGSNTVQRNGVGFQC